MIRRATWRLALCAALILPLGAQAQLSDPAAPQPASFSVYALIPEVVTLRASNEPIAFQIDPANFPPEKWPALYQSAPREISVYANTTGSWTVQLELRDIVTETGALIVPVGRLSFRVDGGPWITATGGPQVIHSQVGPSTDWRRLTLEFQVELRGGEPGGSFVADLALSALVLP